MFRSFPEHHFFVRVYRHNAVGPLFSSRSLLLTLV